jgi:hypothetical protein
VATCRLSMTEDTDSGDGLRIQGFECAAAAPGSDAVKSVERATAPIPESALGPALNEPGCYVGRVEGNLYWVMDGTYQSAFLTTSDGVVLFDAPPTIGHNIQRAVDEIAAATGVSNEVMLSSIPVTTPITPAPPRCSAGASLASSTRSRGGCCSATTTRQGRLEKRPSRTAAPPSLGAPATCRTALRSLRQRDVDG